MNTKNRVIFNTGILYAKMAITMIISLYSVRLVLASLGEIDYGIFNVIMGVVSMLSFLNSALTVSTQRYLSFYQGRGNVDILRKVFSHSLLLHCILGLLLVAMLELFGGYILEKYLTIPIERLDVAKIVFHIASISVFFTFVSVPYSSSINANERMEYIAIISILESLEKMGLAVYLTYTSCDGLLLYGIGMGGITILSFVIYCLICCVKFDECRKPFPFPLDFVMLKDMGGFISWNIVGAITSMSKNQGLAVLFNVFRGPAVNAAYGVANQISAQLNFFSATMIRSINPQIMKSEGAGNHDRMLTLSLYACKYSFLLLAFFAIPCIFEMDTILNIWLKTVPNYTIIFCICILLAMMFDQLTVGINSAFQACKFVKESSVFVGAVKLLILPVGAFLLTTPLSVYYVVLFYAVVELCAGGVRLVLAKKLLRMAFSEYLTKVCLRVIIPTCIVSMTCIIIRVFMVENPYRIIITFVLSFLSFFVSAYWGSLQQEERTYISNIVNKVIKRKYA